MRQIYNPFTGLVEFKEQALNGKDGMNGVMGPQGLRGPQGEKGLTGDVGPQGLKGDKGDTGLMGPQGPIGLTGEQGLPGKDGMQGFAGPIGPQGQSGVVGNTVFAVPIEPKNNVGVDGDLALAMTGLMFLKERGQWKLYANLAGGRGRPGSDATVNYATSRSNPQTLATNGAISLSAVTEQIVYVAGNGGAVTGITIPAPADPLRKLILIGTSSVNTVTLSDSGIVDLNGACTLKSGSVINLIWDNTSRWLESSRNDF